jgi:hypothetical protein
MRDMASPSSPKGYASLYASAAGCGRKGFSSWTSMRRLNMSLLRWELLPTHPSQFDVNGSGDEGLRRPYQAHSGPLGSCWRTAGWLTGMYPSTPVPLPGADVTRSSPPVRPLPPLSLRADLAAPPTSLYAHLAAHASRPGGGGCRIGAAPGGARGSCICRSRSGTLRRWLPAYRAVGRTRKTPGSAPRAVPRSRWRRRRGSARP